MGNVLVIDDDAAVCDALSELLTHMGHTVDTAMRRDAGLEQATSGAYDVILLDVKMPDGSGLDLLPQLKSLSNDPEVIIVTGYGTAKGAEFALKNGAWDYLEKKASVEDILLSINRALQYQKEKRGSEPLAPVKRERIIGNSPNMRPCFDLLAQAAASEVNALIVGETGTGKELFARAIHTNSPRAAHGTVTAVPLKRNPRAEKNFVVVDCAALPETLVESVLFGHEKGAFTGADQAQEGLVAQADGGTLFLDEVGELPLPVQKNFLRVLQEKWYRPVGSKREKSSNFRLVAATHRDLDQLQHDGKFRQDLLFRIRALTIELPPLRERKEDIKELVRHHTARLCRSYKMGSKEFAPDLLDALMAYNWPGNVRELVNTIDSMLAVAGTDTTLLPKHLPLHIRVKIVCNTFKEKASAPEAETACSEAASTDPESLVSFKEYRLKAEKRYLEDLMAGTCRNIAQACKISGISRSRLYELLTKHQIGDPLDEAESQQTG
jgi:two-component system NtrC family response regulator